MTRRSGLGRGLDALLPPDATESMEGGPLREISVEDVDPNPRQPRLDFDEAALEELAMSIRELGLLQPLLVRESHGRYELVAGERRLRAARAAGLDRVPALVVDTDERGSLERALVENIHRADLNPLEEAAGYRQLLQEGGLTHEALGERLGKNRVTITNALRLLELPMSVQKLIRDGLLAAGHARALLPLNGNPFQERLALRAAHEGLSVRQIEEDVRKYEAIATGGKDRPRSRPRPAEAAEAEKRLGEHLNARVRVTMGRTKGKIAIEFSSLDELARLTETMIRTPVKDR